MRKYLGFTLIEVLIALTLFAILAAITSSSMYYAFNARSRVSAQADRLNALQLTIALIKQDIEEIAARPIRGTEVHLLPSFLGLSNYIELTRAGLPNPNGAEKRSTLKRIALLCLDNQLIRRSWSTLDAPNRDIFEDKVLLGNLDDCHFAFLDTSLQLLNEWRINSMPTPPTTNSPTTNAPTTIKMLPKAVQLTLALPNWGKGTFLFIVPEALYENI